MHKHTTPHFSEGGGASVPSCPCLRTPMDGELLGGLRDYSQVAKHKGQQQNRRLSAYVRQPTTLIYSRWSQSGGFGNYSMTTNTINLLKKLIFRRLSLFSSQLVVPRRRLHDNTLILQYVISSHVGASSRNVFRCLHCNYSKPCHLHSFNSVISWSQVSGVCTLYCNLSS